MDDLRQKRPTPTKTQYKRRVKALLATAEAQRVAKACAKKFRSVCQKVVRNKGAAAGN